MKFALSGREDAPRNREEAIFAAGAFVDVDGDVNIILLDGEIVAFSRFDDGPFIRVEKNLAEILESDDAARPVRPGETFTITF